MKIFLSLENTAENRELTSLLKKLEQYEITDHFDRDNKTTVIVNGPLTQLSEMLLTRMLYSGLIDADWSATAEFDEPGY
ncbi:MAG: hypothetical protein IIY33_02495, partial [Erysipelotrichaceae bacterium]|nr:hypothetical protein [Erysipelotrichaceae bacterium]